METITPEGAGLIAQIVTFGLLILAIEARGIWTKNPWANLILFFLALGVLLASMAVLFLCVIAVNNGMTWTGGYAKVIVAVVLVQFFTIFIGLMQTMDMNRSEAQDKQEAPSQEPGGSRPTT